MDAALFPTRLRELREAAGLSQMDLAMATGLRPDGATNVSQRVISNYERGEAEPTLGAVVLLAKALGVSVSAFLTAGPDAPSALPRRRPSRRRRPGTDRPPD